MEIDLLRGRDTIAAAGIKEVARSAVDVVIADIFDEEKCALGEFAFEHQSRFGGDLVGRVRWSKEICEHAIDAPTATQLPRPRKLQVGLHSRARDGLGAGRQSGPERRGEIDLSRQGTDLPFDRWYHIGESRIQWCPQ